MSNATEEIMNVINMSPEDQESYWQSLPPDKTSTILIEDLLKKDKTDYRDHMIARAEKFMYDDFKTHQTTHLCPKIMLQEECTKLGYHDIAVNVTRGKYD